MKYFIYLVFILLGNVIAIGSTFLIGFILKIILDYFGIEISIFEGMLMLYVWQEVLKFSKKAVGIVNERFD